MARKTKKRKTRKKGKRRLREIHKARVYIQATFNNTIITFTDLEGDTLCWSSTGRVGFRGTRKHTPYAATTAVEAAAKRARTLGVNEIEVYIKGPGTGRSAALRALKQEGFKMSMIADITPLPHNGPRPKKKRRV